MGRYKNHFVLAFVILVIFGLFASDNRLSKPLATALSIVASVTALLGVGIAVALRVHKRKQAAAMQEFNDV
jgi:hypothetical protein